MRRPGPRTTVAVGLVASLVLALLAGLSLLPATGEQLLALVRQLGRFRSPSPV